MTAHLYMGVDPGLSGAVAVFDPARQHLTLLDMPVHSIRVGRGKRKQIDLGELARFVDVYAADVAKATIESVHAMPKQGVSSSFSFGFAAGVVQGVIAAHFIPVQLVTPAVWKRALGLTSDKDASRQLAGRVFARQGDLFRRKKDDGRAEAALLARYGATL
jgi:crossover junction endodeoxyribonuclease RuvC